jgi:hypothetical protein
MRLSLRQMLCLVLPVALGATSCADDSGGNDDTFNADGGQSDGGLDGGSDASNDGAGDAGGDIGPDVDPDDLEGPIRFDINPDMVLATAALPGPDGSARPTGAVGTTGLPAATFVLNEMLVVGTPAAIEAAATQVAGTVLARQPLADGDEVAIVSFDPPSTDAEAVAADLTALVPQGAGKLSVNGEAALNTLGAILTAATTGVMAAPNFVMTPGDLGDRTTAESATGPDYGGGPAGVGPTQGWSYTANAFEYPYVRGREGGWVGSGVGEAWRLLELAGVYASGTKVRVAVIDGGFLTRGGAIPEPVQFWSTVTWAGSINDPNPMTCTGTNPCPWHGTLVTQTVNAPFDDGVGGVGSAAGIAEVGYFVVAGDMFGAVAAVSEVSRNNYRVANMSFGVPIPILLGALLTPFDIALAASREVGDLSLIACSSNFDADVDYPNLLLDLLTWWPCESPAVTCVGATSWEGGRQPYSNWASSQNSVDLFAPDALVAFRPPNDGSSRGTLTLVTGTSFSSPWVAGIVALARAAGGDAVDNDDVEAWLRTTAAPAAHSQVSRMVDAEALVRQALTANGVDLEALLPSVELVTPTPGTLPAGNIQLVADGRGGSSSPSTCCTFEWTSSRAADGALGGGPNIAPRLGPGEVTISVRAIDSEGYSSAPASVDLTLTNALPEIEISPLGRVLAGSTIALLAARVSDDSGGIMDCTTMTGNLLSGAGAFVSVSSNLAEGGCIYMAQWTGVAGEPVTFRATATDIFDGVGTAEIVLTPEAIDAGEVYLAVWSPLADAFYLPTDRIDYVADARNLSGADYLWTLTPLDDDENALMPSVSVAFSKDLRNQTVAAIVPSLENTLCVRGGGQKVLVTVEAAAGGDTLVSDSHVIYVGCPPG